MKMLPKYKPWIFMWLPWVAVLVGVIFLVLQESKGNEKPAPRLVTREPGLDLAFLQSSIPERKAWNPGSAEAFLGPTPQKADEMPAGLEEPKEPMAQGVTVKVSGVVLGSRVRVSVINGVPYEEGSLVPEAGLVERIHKEGVTIVADNGKRVFVGVGKKADL